MPPNIPQAVSERIAEYRRFLRTSYRIPDDDLRRQFEDRLDRTDVIVRGHHITLARDYEQGETLDAIVR